MQQHNKYPGRFQFINPVIIPQFTIMLLFVKKTTNKSFVKECEALNRETQRHWCISEGMFLGGSYWSLCTRSWDGWCVVCWERDWERLHSADLFCRGAGLVSVALALLQAVVVCCLLSKKSVILKVVPWTQWGWSYGPCVVGLDCGNCLTGEHSCIGAQWGWHLLNKHTSLAHIFDYG